MKIALVTPYDYPYPGGVTEHITCLDRELRRRGHDTRIIAPSSREAAPLDNHVLRVSEAIWPLPISGSSARITLSPRVFRRVKEIMDHEHFDLVHVHEPGVPVVSLAALRYSNAVNVGTFHAYRDSNLVYQAAPELFGQAYGRLHGRIFVSEAVRDYITRYYPGDFTIIPNGVETARFGAADIHPIERFDDGRPNILFVGRLDERKGFRHLLGALARIQNQCPHARLIVVGAYTDEEKAPFVLEARAQHLRSVHFVGWVSREELPRYYRTATVFCAPSIGFESFGMVLLEAMAAGVPIVASDIAGYRTVLTNAREGYLVAPGDENALAEAVFRVIHDPARAKEMGRAGQMKSALYDWSLIADRVLDYYGELIERRARRAVSPRARVGRFSWQQGLE
jgi:phosphatidylinositol alpha-mannosyltransferase